MMDMLDFLLPEVTTYDEAICFYFAVFDVRKFCMQPFNSKNYVYVYCCSFWHFRESLIKVNKRLQRIIVNKNLYTYDQKKSF